MRGVNFFVDTYRGIGVFHLLGHPIGFTSLEYTCSKISDLKFGAYRVLRSYWVPCSLGSKLVCYESVESIRV